jgi:hypothetical protein
MKIKQFIKVFTHNPWLNMLIFVAMLISAGHEVWQSIQQFELGSHHGVFLFALLQCLKTLPDLVEPLESFNGNEAEG